MTNPNKHSILLQDLIAIPHEIRSLREAKKMNMDMNDEFIFIKGTAPGMAYCLAPRENVLRSLRLIRDELSDEEGAFDFFLDEAKAAIEGFSYVLSTALMSADIDALKHLQEMFKKLAVFERARVEEKIFNHIIFDDIVENFDADPDSDADTAPDADAAS